MQATYSTVSGQLRKAAHIHHVYVLPRVGSHKGILLLLGRWEDRGSCNEFERVDRSTARTTPRSARILLLTEDTEKLLNVPDQCPKSAISWVMTSEPKALAAYCQCNGLMVRGIVPPTVPAGTERIRICLHAGNTVKQIDALVETIRSWVERRKADKEGTAQVRGRL